MAFDHLHLSNLQKAHTHSYLVLHNALLGFKTSYFAFTISCYGAWRACRVLGLGPTLTPQLGCRFPVSSADFWLCLRKFCGEADRGRLDWQQREFKTYKKSTAQVVS